MNEYIVTIKFTEPLAAEILVKKINEMGYACAPIKVVNEYAAPVKSANPSNYPAPSENEIDGD